MTARLQRYVLSLAALAAVALGIAATAQARAGFPAGPLWTSIAAITFIAAFWGLGQTSFTFVWRGNRHRLVLDEIAIYVGVLALPAMSLPLLVAGAALLEQARMRREWLKAVFNLAQNVLATTTGVLVYVLLSRYHLAPPTVAAIPAAFAYPLVSNFLVSGVFSRLSEIGQLRVFAERLLAPGLLAGSVGAGGGVAVAALWALHPLTLIALMPFVFLTYRYGVLSAAADRELDVHKRLADVTRELVGVRDVALAVRRVLVACGDAFPSVGRAALDIEGEPPIVEDFGPGPEPHAQRHEHREPVPGVGTLRLLPRRAANGFTDVEKALVRIVAQQLAATVGQARALQRMETIARQEKLSALGTLVAGVAHEINNPVTYMRGALELANMDLDEVDATTQDHAAVQHAKVTLQKLADGVDRVQKITHALKAVARQGTGERGAEDVRVIAEDVVQVVSIGLPKGVSLDAQLPEKLPRVRANAAEMHQVVLNLVKNASEALAPTGGHIGVRAWAENDSVLVEVADDGPGIPLDVQKRLFEPFFTTKREGTGLGLSLSRGIIEAHGGELRLDSAPGKGTRFTIRLPAA